MSASAWRRLLIQLLRQYLQVLASGIRELSPRRLINRLLVFLISFRRRTHTNSSRSSLRLHQCRLEDSELPVSSASSTLGNGVVCAMNAPSPGPSNTQEHGQSSPVDLPYTNARKSSNHLIIYSPATVKRYLRDYIPWLTVRKTLLPSSVNHDVPQLMADTLRRTSSSNTVHTHQGNQPSLDILVHSSHLHNPLHQTFDFAVETAPRNLGVQPSPQSAHIHLNTNNVEPQRSLPYSMRSSSPLSVFHESDHSRDSIGRASYREHHGLPRGRAAAPDQDACGSNTFGTVIVEPSLADPNRLREPTVMGLRFSPMSVNGVLRYDSRKIR